MPHIQRAHPRHAELIAALLRDAFLEFEPLYTAAAFRATTPTPAEVVRRFSDGPTWIATEGATILGTVSALEQAGEVRIRSMAVLPAARGRHIASDLLTVVRDFAVSVNAHRLTLSTTPFLAAAIRLYERHGFCQAAGTFDLHGTPLIAMTRELRSGSPVLRRFEQPDETRTFEYGRFELITLRGMIIGRAMYEPGWRWSTHVGAKIGQTHCTVAHIGLVLSGHATAAMADGVIHQLTPGELFYIPSSPHDSWVVGDEPYVSLHFMGAEAYARH